MPVSAESGEVAREGREGEKKGKNLRLDFPFWLAAWEGYMLAAHALEQVPVFLPTTCFETFAVVFR